MTSYRAVIECQYTAPTINFAKLSPAVMELYRRDQAKLAEERERGRRELMHTMAARHRKHKGIA